MKDAGSSAPAVASTFTSKATAQMMQAHRTECRALTRDTKKQVPSSQSPLHKYRQAFSLPTGRLHQYTSQMEPNEIRACWILHFKTFLLFL